ncbi:FKBP-type peptidyl-prolyl cis-trans isomerase [Anaerobium acetethylicum]|uniref:peptidylprolyl isomerase n=1 Tax=Anaerobium acetethylicum TaxID=1619234 RepID=A0A1D3TYZ4_9FIRM|nr:FKBP-type peptidyl-prolyl cis-trans isomerase [Anaerobium acetethylicum]SCP99722.1 trigger factor [Anaerobium acetethylicum]
MGKPTENTSMTPGQKKRLAHKQEIQKAKKRSLLIKIASFCAVGLIAAGLIAAIGYTLYKNATTVQASSDYSKYLTADGLIKDTTASDLVKLADYKSITVPLSEIEYPDASVETDIQTLLADYSTLETETDALIADGDKVNIDYVGSIDGTEFEGGNTDGAGADLVIGSGSYVDDFEDQLIGHGAGDAVTVEVTFPTDYSSADLAGKDAVFEVTINGIYATPEFTDAFVTENLSEYASTTDEYREYVKQSNYDTNLDKWLMDYLMENTTVSSYPEKYTDQLKSLKKYTDQNAFEYMNNMYTSMGYDAIASFEEYTGMSEKEYEASLVEAAQDQAKKALIFQAILEAEGLSVTADEYGTYFGDDASADYDTQVEQYGEGYVMQTIITEKVMDLVKGNATVK